MMKTEMMECDLECRKKMTHKNTQKYAIIIFNIMKKVWKFRCEGDYEGRER